MRTGAECASAVANGLPVFPLQDDHGKWEKVSRPLESSSLLHSWVPHSTFSSGSSRDETGGTVELLI